MSPTIRGCRDKAHNPPELRPPPHLVISLVSRRPQLSPAVTAEVSESDIASMDMVEELGEGLVEINSSSEDSGGLYIPDFLAEAPVGGNWVLNARVARAIQADEQLKKHCFACQSPDHFIRDCPQAKNGRRPLQPRGPPKTTQPQ